MLFRFLLFTFGLICLSCGPGKQESSPDNPPVPEMPESLTEDNSETNMARHWLLEDYDVTLFIEKKTVDNDGKAKLEAALQSLIGVAFYNLKENGNYTAGTGGAITSGTWSLSEDGKTLTLQQPSEEGRTIKPTEFTVVKLSSDQLILIDKDGLKVTFSPSE